MGWDVIIHSTAGILSLALGAFMVLDLFPWATDAFSIMMVIAFTSALIILSLIHISEPTRPY